MIFLVLGCLALLLLAARLSVRVFLVVLLPVSPVLLAMLGSVLGQMFALAAPSALALSALLLVLLIGLPAMALWRAPALRRKRQATRPDQRD